MKPSSSSSSSSSVTAAPETPRPSFSSRPPRQSLQSPELQAEFLQEFRNKSRFHRDVGESSAVSSPPSSPLPSPLSSTPLSSPCSSSASSSSSPPGYDKRQARLSLSSPELLSELKHSRTRSLRHVPEHNGLTTVFSGRGRGGGGGGGGGRRGRGRQASGPTPTARPANQMTSH
ncbi:homeobox protein Hox-B3-like isoform X2 [Micropterus salmoides]|uniref:homeobox protein Hox-B3-like isoform X2 n=1 Tax=Micropterus salmoides TaxID=27706 RepID=UPI0018EDA870|nr:homeobox protein Hox-B3-like isoform X2 [Micropterus salmoides]